jgi:hypothetical protein
VTQRRPHNFLTLSPQKDLMADFRVRVLEIHSTYAWDFAWVKKAIRFIPEHDLTAMVLHRNDIVDRVVYPGRYFGAEPSRRSIATVHRQLYKHGTK